MPDSRAREIYRQAASGDIESEARHLVSRLRDGSLSQARLRLAAYCGHGAGRAIEEWPPDDGLYHAPIYMDSDDQCNGARKNAVCCYCAEFPEWLTGLRTLAADLDGLGDWEERCDNCRATGKIAVLGGSDRCFDCQGTGIRRVPWNGSKWVMVRAAVVAAELALPVWAVEGVAWNSAGRHCPEDVHNARKAIEAAKDYQCRGTLEAREAWRDAVVACGMVRWVPDSEPVSRNVRAEEIQAAVRVVEKPCDELGNYGHNARVCGCANRISGEARVRAAICANLVEWALRP